MTKKDLVESLQAMIGLMVFVCIYAYLGGWITLIVVGLLLVTSIVRPRLQARQYRRMNAAQTRDAIERQKARLRELEAVLCLPEPRYDEAELSSERRRHEDERRELEASLLLLEDRLAVIANPTYRSLV